MTAHPPPVNLPTRLLVLGLEGPDGVLDAARVYDVAAASGMTEQQVRLCLRRLVAEGHYRQSGRGKNATFTAASAADRHLPELEFLELASRQDQGQASWDGAWRLIHVTVPEAQRAVRDRARSQLAALGAASLGGGLYISPHDLRDHLAEVLTEFQHLGVALVATTTDLEYQGIRDPRAIAARLWPVAELETRYRALRDQVHAMSRSVPAVPDSVTALALVFGCVTAAASVMDDDPLLPRELLPHPWAGTAARDAVEQLLLRLQGTLPADHSPAIVRLLGLRPVSSDQPVGPPPSSTRSHRKTTPSSSSGLRR